MIYEGSSMATAIPKNFWKKTNNVFFNRLEEIKDNEQFFWSRETVEKLAKACEFTFVEETCCLTTPSLAHYWHENGREETLLDIDTRFSYIPGFKYYDLRKPDPDIGPDDNFRLLIIDPPFFIVPIETIGEAVDQITGKDYDTKIIIGFLSREEKRLQLAFEHYCLKPTKFPLQYPSIKENKWQNFVLYSNIDLPGIKRLKE
jgi:hypothetical protein